MTTNLLDKIQREIATKEGQLAALQGELEELRLAVSVLSLIPEDSLADLDAVARVLHRFADAPQAQSDFAGSATVSVGANGAHPSGKGRLSAEKDLSKKTILECAAKILGERGGASVHYRDLLQEALSRGYRGRVSSTPDQVERSWIQTLRKVSLEGGPVERTGEGLFKLRVKVKADAG